LFKLAAVTDPAAVPDAVAAALGITQQPGKSVTESVAAALEGGLGHSQLEPSQLADAMIRDPG
jgi:predicted ATPase